MYLNINELTEAQRGYIPFDLDKMDVIKNCVWADDKTGKFCVYDKDNNGNYHFLTDDLGREILGENRQLKMKIKKSRIMFMDCINEGKHNG